jgi:anaerobic selenocysteine-containing dehydrogenase
MAIANDEKIIRSYCRFCHGSCGVYVHVRDGKVVKVEPDPESPISHGQMCSKGLASVQIAYHPDRVLYPLKRTGEKGEGKWQRISWDEALDTIADKYRQLKKDFGAESIVLGYGTGRDYETYLYRFANLLGTPNVLTAGHQCYGSRVAITTVTCGNLPICDYERDPKCVIVWGNNIVWTNPDEYMAILLNKTLAKGAKLIVVDPRCTYLAGRADVWLKIRPGTDTALAFGFANVIINEGLYDKEFVEKWVHGWDKFVERVQQYPLDRVSEITWIPVEKIQEAARLYAQTKPACIQWGISIEQTINCIDNNRLLTDLMAITGNLDVPGGNVIMVPPPIQVASTFGAHRQLPVEQRKKRLGGTRFRLADRIAVIDPRVVWDAVLTEKPYPVKAIQLHGSNPVITREGAQQIYEALKKVEFLVVADFFITPTAELADIILPAATWLEMDNTADSWKRSGYVFAKRKIVQIGECWQDHKMFSELGKRLGQEEYWGKDVEADLDLVLSPSGINFKQFIEKGYLKGKLEYRKHEKSGFSTPTRKVEIYSTILEDLGYDPLPQYREAPESPISTPELAKKYPYILTTGFRSPVFFHSEFRQIPWLRDLHRDPIVEMHPDTAAKHNIKEGDWVYIENHRGKIRQKAKFNISLDPRVIAAEHGWWFPERKSPDHGWDISNINLLVSSDLEQCDPAMGSNNMRALLCTIYSAPEPEV